MALDRNPLTNSSYRLKNRTEIYSPDQKRSPPKYNFYYFLRYSTVFIVVLRKK